MTITSQYVTLGVDREIFGIPVQHVQEILDMRPIIRLPHAPADLLGMIDVRGRGVPVIDLRTRLGLPPGAISASTRILVLEVPAPDADPGAAPSGPASRAGGERPLLVLGLLADRVYEVTALDGAGLEPVPEIGGRWRSDTIAGIGRRGDAFVVVFNLDRLFAIGDGPVLADGPARRAV